MNVIGYIRQAAGDDEMRRRAAVVLADALDSKHGDALGYQGRSLGVRASDYGACALALWAQFQGLEDVARDPIDDALARLDAGSMFGAWLAALFFTAAEAEGISVALEHVPSDGGHVDALALDPLHVIEFKTKWDAKQIPDPERESRNHLLQAARYGGRTGAEQFTLVYFAPPAPKGARMKQFTYDTRTWLPLADEEERRLSVALLEDPPIADPQARYSCFTCRYSVCAKNKNKNLDSVEDLF